jgi:hypothetical protein
VAAVVTRALFAAALAVGLGLGGAAAQGASAACEPQAAIEFPREGTTVGVGPPLGIEGWAVDRTAPAGAGVLSVQVTLDVPREDGGTPVVALHTEERPDVARQLGERFRFSGYRVDLPTGDLATGLHTLYVAILTRCGWHTETRDVTLLPPGETVA